MFQVIRQTFSIKTSGELVMSPVEKFTFAIKIITITVFPPEGEIHMPCDVMNIHTHIFTKVGNTLFRVLLGTSVSHCELSRCGCHLSSVSLIDYFAVGEHVRCYFIQRWEDQTISNRVMDDRNKESINKYSLIHPLTEVYSITEEAGRKLFTCH